MTFGFFLDITGFTDYLRLRDSREITINRHIRCLKLICSKLTNFDKESVKTYLDGLKLSGITNLTLNNYITTIRLYAQFLKLDKELTSYPLFPRHQLTVRRTLPDELIEAFLAVPCGKWMLPVRHDMFTVFWSLLAFCAFRPGEAARLKKTDMDLLNKQVMLRPEITKTNQFSTIPLFPNIFPLIKDYVENLTTEYLFPSRHGGKYDNGQEPVISQGDWGEDFNKRLKYIGVEKTKDLVPYSLRHSACSRWINGDMSIFKVNRLMRHTKLEQTLHYTHMTSGQLVQSAIKHDPLIRKSADPSAVLESAEENLSDFGLYKDARISEKFKKKIRDAFLEEQSRLIAQK